MEQEPNSPEALPPENGDVGDVADADLWTPSKADYSNFLEPAPKRILPFPKWMPFVAGLVIGIGVRVLFSGKAGNAFGAMMGSFIFLMPFLVGATTVYTAELIERRSWGYYMGASMLATLLVVVGTLCLAIEGLICAILIVPVACIAGACGGVLLGLVCRLTMQPRAVLLGIGATLVILGSVEQYLPLPQHEGDMSHTVTIQAPASVVWQQIAEARNIRANETAAWSSRIGVPRPISGIVIDTPEGKVRKVKWDKGVHFDEVITDWQENRHMAWNFRFQADSFPEHALDDHVTIGGKYFDMKSADFTLAPRGEHNEATELTLHLRYREGTQFNWYTDAIASGLINNFEEVILTFYQRRSEAISKSVSADTGAKH